MIGAENLKILYFFPFSMYIMPNQGIPNDPESFECRGLRYYRDT